MRPRERRGLPGSALALAFIALSCSVGGGLTPPGSTSECRQNIPGWMRPDWRRPWAGAVALQLPAMNGPPADVRVDGRPLETPPGGSPTLDTAALAEGAHHLSWSSGGSDFCVPFTVENGAAPPVPTGRFVEVTQEVLGRPASVGELEKWSGVVTADVDQDGLEDLLAFGADGARVLHANAHGTYEKTQEIPGNFMSAAAGDLDRDGWPDLMLGGGTLTLLHNDHGTFVDVTADSGIPVREETDGFFEMISLTDLDADGLTDAANGFISCGSTKASVLLRNEGAMHFTDVAVQLGFDVPHQATFGFTFDRPFGDDQLVAWSLFEGCAPRAPTLTFLGPGDDLPVVKSRPPQNGTAEVLMGSAWLDANADGVLDYFATGTDFSPLMAGPALTTDRAEEVGLMAFPDERGNVMEQWAAPLIDADLDGLADLFVTQEHAPEPPDGHLKPRTRLMRQGPPGKFRDVGGPLGAVLAEHCEGASVIDYDRDGDGDLFVRCEKAVHVLRNDVAPEGSGRTVILRGTVSNPDAIDTRLSSPGSELRLHRGGAQLRAGGAFPESLKIKGSTLHVEWPSGVVEDHPIGAGPLVSLTEPEVVRLSRRRVAPGDSAGVEVEVEPGLGKLSDDVHVKLAGAGWQRALSRGNDGIWRGTVAIPPSRGTVSLTVSFGDRTLRVRPRIFVR